MTEKERRFVEAYMGHANGNATQAAILAGYAAKSAHVTGCQLLRKPKITEAIQYRVDTDPAVADREERQRFLTAMLRDKEAHPAARLKACDQLAKTQGDYIERVEVTGNMQVEHDLTADIRQQLDTLAAAHARSSLAASPVVEQGSSEADPAR